MVKSPTSERQPYEPWPFRLTRAGTYPEVEDAIEDILTAALHTRHKEAFLAVAGSWHQFATDRRTRSDAEEYIRTCLEIRDQIIERAPSWPNDSIAPDLLVAVANVSNRRLWYLEPIPVMPGKFMPLLPEITLADNRLLVAAGFLLGSRDPYQDWVRLWTEIEFGKGCWAEISRRLEKTTVDGLYLSLIQSPVPAQEDAYQKLLSKAMSAGSTLFLHPDWQRDLEEKIGVADLVIAKDVERFEGVFSEDASPVVRDVLRGDFERIGTKFKQALIDSIRKASAKKRIPQELTTSLEGIPDESGREVEYIDRTLQKSDVIARINSSAEEIVSACGPRAPDIMKCLLEEPTLTNEAVARRLRLSERQVYNIRACLKENRDLIRRICFGR